MVAARVPSWITEGGAISAQVSPNSVLLWADCGQPLWMTIHRDRAT
jgi:hypothetical protein